MSSLDVSALPDDPAVLRELVLSLRQQVANQQQLLQSQERELVLLQQQLAELKRQRYGRKSEKLDEQIRQLELIIEDLEANGASIAPAPVPDAADAAPKTPHRKPLPEHLPTDTLTHDVPSCCEDCGGDLCMIGEDVSEQLEYVPARFKRIRHVRPKYSCRQCDTVVQAAAPSKPIARSFAGPGLLAHVAVSKFTDHLPLYRQSQIYEREGVNLKRSTLADWMGQVCRLLNPLQESLKQYVMAANKLHGDDTPVPVLQPGRKTTKQGRLWAYLRDDRTAGIDEPAAVWFAYTPDRKSKWPVEHLDAFHGHLQADGYTGFNALYQTGRIYEVACWAHVRRKFYEIAQTDPKSMAHEVLRSIAELYAIEEAVRGQPAEQRRQVRQARAGPIVDELKTRLTTAFNQVSRKSPIAKAMHYALTRWGALSRYLDNGRLEIDNNAVERQIRPVALGRKNYLFAGADSGGERAAMFYSLLNTAKLNGIEPESYLRTVIERIADTPVNAVDQLLPWNINMDGSETVNV